MPQQHLLHILPLIFKTLLFLCLNVFLQSVNPDPCTHHSNLSDSHSQAYYGCTNNQQGLCPNNCRMRNTNKQQTPTQLQLGHTAHLCYTQLWSSNKYKPWSGTIDTTSHLHAQDLHPLTQHPAMMPHTNEGHRQPLSPIKQLLPLQICTDGRHRIHNRTSPTEGELHTATKHQHSHKQQQLHQ